MKPIVKWVGGKRQLLSTIRKKLPVGIRTCCEPFIGGGAVLLDLVPDHAIINDANPELINLHRVARDNPKALVEELKQHTNTLSHFKAVRNLDRDLPTWALLSNVERAARYLYLNKTCFNGLMRVNRHGQFNAAYGGYTNPCICPEEEISMRSMIIFSAMTSRFCAATTVSPSKRWWLVILPISIPHTHRYPRLPTTRPIPPAALGSTSRNVSPMPAAILIAAVSNG